MYLVLELFLYLVGSALNFLDELGIVFRFTDRVGGGDDDNRFVSFFVENKLIRKDVVR